MEYWAENIRVAEEMLNKIGGERWTEALQAQMMAEKETWPGVP